MCGIVGCLGNINNSEKKMFRDMLVFDQVRGFDSTGIVIVPYAQNKQPSIVKEVGPAQNLWDFAAEGQFDHRGVVKEGVNVLIGHNRAATLGSVTVDNAHPFQFDHVYGVHNGSLRVWDDLEDANLFEVDSQAIYNDIAINGIEHTWKNFFGAAALVWYDEDNNKVHMIRNSERPLYVARSAASNALFWASEPWMITVAAARQKVKLAEERGKPDVISLDTDTLYTITPTISSFVAEEERKLEKKPTPTITTVFGNNGNRNTGFKGTSTKKDSYNDGRSFFPSKKWKQGTARLRNALGPVTISNIRHVDRTLGDKKTTETVFRLDIYRQGSLVGRLDVYPTNIKEFSMLKEIEGKDLKKISSFSFSLINNPRLDSRTSGGCSRYVCAYSTLKVKEFRIPEVKKSDEVVDIVDKAVKDLTSNIAELPLYKGLNNESITLSEAEDLIRKCGDACCYCSEIIEPKDLSTGMFIEKDQFLCPTCTENWGGDIPTFLRSIP